jgi:hypothetical protein
MTVAHMDQRRCNDITYILFAYGFLYLMALPDWHSRYVLAWAFVADYSERVLPAGIARLPSNL